jgi:sugar phosphate isomerase/epimerase
MSTLTATAPASAPAPVALERLSLNQITANQHDMRAVIEACARHDIRFMSVWRHKLADLGLAETASLLRQYDIGVSSLCRGGFFPAATAEERAKRIDDNRRAIDEAAELGTDVLVLVCGPAPTRDLESARSAVVAGIEALLPYAERLGVRLGVEALHPVYTGDRSVVVTLGQANTIAERFPSDLVGVVVDVYHVWWDPCVHDEIRRAGDRILGYHVSDWLVPPPDPLMGRGLMGDGVIDLKPLRATVEAAGYDGPIEVEIFNQKVWDMSLDEMLPLIRSRFAETV